MNQYLFGFGWGRVGDDEAARRDAIAKRVGGSDCGFICTDPTPGQWQYWFFGPNRGVPFDGQLERRILAAVYDGEEGETDE